MRGSVRLPASTAKCLMWCLNKETTCLINTSAETHESRLSGEPPDRLLSLFVPLCTRHRKVLWMYLVRLQCALYLSRTDCRVDGLIASLIFFSMCGTRIPRRSLCEIAAPKTSGTVISRSRRARRGIVLSNRLVLIPIPMSNCCVVVASTSKPASFLPFISISLGQRTKRF